MNRRDEEHREQQVITPRLILGVALILIGAAFILDQIGLVHSGDIFRFWPVLLILAGLGKLTRPGGSSFGGLVLVAVGIWLLLEIFDYVDLDFGRVFPILLILFGLKIVLDGGRNRRRKADRVGLPGSDGERDVADDAGSVVNAMAVLGGVTRHSRSPAFRGGDLVAFLGAVDLDLRDARIVSSPAVIDAFAFWGGIEIRVPDDWEVNVEGVALLGAYEDSTRRSAPAEHPGTKQELIIKGFAIMGGVEIK